MTSFRTPPTFIPTERLSFSRSNLGERVTAGDSCGTVSSGRLDEDDQEARYGVPDVGGADSSRTP